MFLVFFFVTFNGRMSKNDYYDYYPIKLLWLWLRLSNDDDDDGRIEEDGLSSLSYIHY